MDQKEVLLGYIILLISTVVDTSMKRSVLVFILLISTFVGIISN